MALVVEIINALLNIIRRVPPDGAVQGNPAVADRQHAVLEGFLGVLDVAVDAVLPQVAFHAQIEVVVQLGHLQFKVRALRLQVGRAHLQFLLALGQFPALVGDFRGGKVVGQFHLLQLFPIRRQFFVELRLAFGFLERGALGQQVGLLGKLVKLGLERGAFGLKLLLRQAVFKFEPLLLGGEFGQILGATAVRRCRFRVRAAASQP